MVGNRDGPALGERSRNQQELELGHRTDGSGAAPQRVGGKAPAGDRIDGALVGHDRQRSVGRPFGGHQHRRDGGLRLSVEVGTAVEQLRGLEFLRDQPQEGELDVAGSQYGARVRMLESGRGAKERVVGRNDGSGPVLQRLVGSLADPLGSGRPRHAAQVHLGIVA